MADVANDDLVTRLVTGPVPRGKRPKTVAEHEKLYAAMTAAMERLRKQDAERELLLETMRRNAELEKSRRPVPPSVSDEVLSRQSTPGEEIRWAMAMLAWPADRIDWTRAPSAVAVTILWQAMQSPESAERLTRLYLDKIGTSSSSAKGNGAGRNDSGRRQDVSLKQLIGRVLGDATSDLAGGEEGTEFDRSADGA